MTTALLYILSLVATPQPAVAPTEIIIGPATKTIRQALVEVKLPGARPRAIPRLVVSGTDREIPCQVYRTDAGKTHIAWVVAALEKDAMVKYSLSWADGPSSNSRSVKIAKNKDGLMDVMIAGTLFTRYIHGEDQHKPYLYPIMLDGSALTRHYPMKQGIKGERSDHPHHRSFYFTHGDVNGVSFWHEGKGTGRIFHRKFERVDSGAVFGHIKARSEWLIPDGGKVLDDMREYRFYSPVDGMCIVDFKVTLTAAKEQVVLGDTKEGTFGIRVAGTLKESSGGRILTARGQEGAGKAWGRPAEWIDYTGKVDGKLFGVAILDHPTSFRHPTHWHVRNYGLFAANPFGYHDFYKKKNKEGNHTLKKGESVTFSYRVVFHRGSTEDTRIAEIWNGFAAPPPVKVK